MGIEAIQRYNPGRGGALARCDIGLPIGHKDVRTTLIRTHALNRGAAFAVPLTVVLDEAMRKG